MSATIELVEYALKAYSQPLPSGVLDITKQAIIDQYGLQIGGSDFPWSQFFYNFHKKHTAANGNSTITRFGEKTSAVHAAFINSCFAHAQDFDDSHQEAQTHPGSVVIPAAIALGEQLERSGERVLAAIVIGMEIMLRLAHAISPACIENGHHTPPTVGPFGAAIACGLLLGLPREQLVNALGICGSYSGGLVEYTLSGGSVKRMHTALGARAGIEAALLAQEGLTGPDTIIEGKKGLLAIFGRDKAFPERLLDQLGSHFMLQTLMFKPYNCCYLIHPAIQAFLELCQEHNLNPEDINSVNVGLSVFSLSHAAKIKTPRDILGAQFSTSYTLALALIKGAPGLRSYTEANLHDQQILSLATKINTYQDKTANNEFPQKNGCIVEINTTSGQQFTKRIRDPKGSPNNSLTADEVKQKFIANTSPTLPDPQIFTLYEALSDFEKLVDVSLLSELVSQPASSVMAKL